MIKNRSSSDNVFPLLHMLCIGITPSIAGIRKTWVSIFGPASIGPIFMVFSAKVIIGVLDKIGSTLKMRRNELCKVPRARIILSRGLMTKAVGRLIDMGLCRIISEGSCTISGICNFPEVLGDTVSGLHY
jgi:hypothetical protein